MKPCFTILVGLINTRFRPNHTLSRNQNSSLKYHTRIPVFFLVYILNMPTSISKFKITKSVDLPSSNDEYITDPTSLFFNKLHPVLDLFIHHQNTIYNRTRLFPCIYEYNKTRLYISS